MTDRINLTAAITEAIRAHSSPMIDRGDAHGANRQSGYIVWESSLPFIVGAVERAMPSWRLEGLTAAREIALGAIRNGCPNLMFERIDRAIADARQSETGDARGYKDDVVNRVLEADAKPPEAKFSNIKDTLNYLDAPSPSPGVSAPARVGSEEKQIKILIDTMYPDLFKRQGATPLQERRLEMFAFAKSRAEENARKALAALRSSAGTFDEGVEHMREAMLTWIRAALSDALDDYKSWGQTLNEAGMTGANNRIAAYNNCAHHVRALSKKDAPK